MKKEILSLLFLIILLITLLSGCTNNTSNTNDGEVHDFYFTLLEGSVKNLSDYRGKVVLVDMWSTWCGPCMVIMPELKKIYDAYNRTELEIISINIDTQETVELIESYIAYFAEQYEIELNWIFARDDRSVAENYLKDGAIEEKGGIKMKKILIVAIVVLGLYFMTASAVAEPEVVSMYIDPAAPEHQATITITAEITGDDVTAVSVMVKECRAATAGGSLAGTCWENNPYSMEDPEDDGTWVATATLQDESGLSTYIDIEFDITDSGELYDRIGNEEWATELTLPADTGDNDDDDGSSGGSPGFEVITLLVAVVIGILLIKRKR
jgi:thiol-disulfide isomerase/thioredoxin